MCVGSFAVAGGDLKEVEPAVTPVVPMVEEGKSGLYAGLGIAALSTRDKTLNFFDAESGQDRTGNIVFLGGYEFNDYIALEGRYSMYLTHEHVINTDVWGIYAKPQYPVNEDIKVYALLGYGGVEVDPVDGYAPFFAADDKGFQWGLGASYDIDEDFTLFVDYMNIATDIDADAFFGNTDAKVDVDTITIGITYNF